MAIYLDDNGWWRDTEKEAAAQAALPGYYDDLLPAKKQERADTETFKALMQPAASAGPDAQAALVGILSDASKPKEARAGAAEALYPGVQASIGRSGELSFRAAPSSDLGFNYPDKTTKAAEGQQALGVKEGSTLLSNLSESVKQLQGLATATDVVNLAGTVAADLTNYTAGKRNELQSAAYSTLGIRELENTLADWKQQDQLYYNQHTGGKNIGPSQETETANLMLTRAKQEAEGIITQALDADPEYSAIRQQAAIFNTILGAKTQQTMIEPENLPDGAAELLASKQLTPTAVLDLSTRLSKGDPTAMKELERFNQPVLNNVVELLGGAITATDKPGLTDTIKKKLGTDGEAVLGQVEAIYTNFDSELRPTLTKEQADMMADLEDKASPTPKKASNTLLSPADKEAARQQLVQMKVQMTINEARGRRDANWMAGVGDWTPPEDPALAAKWTQAVELVKAKHARQDAVEVAERAAKTKDTIVPLTAEQERGYTTSRLNRQRSSLNEVLSAVFELEAQTSNELGKLTTSPGERSKLRGKINERNAVLAASLTKYMTANTTKVQATNLLGGVQGFSSENETRATLNSLAISMMLRQEQSQPIYDPSRIGGTGGPLIGRSYSLQ